jgi:hypothetical protein
MGAQETRQSSSRRIFDGDGNEVSRKLYPPQNAKQSKSGLEILRA